MIESETKFRADLEQLFPAESFSVFTAMGCIQATLCDGRIMVFLDPLSGYSATTPGVHGKYCDTMREAVEHLASMSRINRDNLEHVAKFTAPVLNEQLHAALSFRP